MRKISTRLTFLPPLLAAFIGVAAILPLTDAASAGRFHDRVYADSFGNLIVQSPSGYKRIIVGQGHLAKELAAYTASSEPTRHEYDDRDAYRGDDCYRPPVLLKGRSYMYGLDDGVVPEPSGRCD